MGVVDEFVRQEGMQQGLDRRVGRARVEQVDALEIHHLPVAEPVQRGEPPERLQPDRGQARRLDIGHVPARALDAQHVRRLAQQVGHGGLDRGIAAAMQHQAGIAAQQPRRVDPERHVFRNALVPVAGDHGGGVARRIAASHGFYPAAARRRSG